MRPFDYRDTSDMVRLMPLEWLALLYVPLLATYDDTPLDISAALAALAKGEALIADEQRDTAYEPARVAILSALAKLAHLPGGVTFGRLHFGELL